MRNATVTMSPRLALIVMNLLTVCIQRLEAQIEDPQRKPVAVPGFTKLYHFEDTITSRNLIAELSGLRTDLLRGSVEPELLGQLEDLGDIDEFLR
jgi:hypothetical protein